MLQWINKKQYACEVRAMTVDEMKKYIHDMDEYIKKISEESRKDSLEFLKNAGIVNENGKLASQYREK